MRLDLIEVLIRTTDTAVQGELGNRLLREFELGRSIDELHALFSTPSTEELACWILCELGKLPEAFVPNVATLLRATRWSARAIAVRLVLTCASAQHGELIAQAVERIVDPDDRVRRRCAEMLLFVSREQLVAAAEALESGDRNAEALELVHRLLDERVNMSSLSACMLGTMQSQRLGAIVAAFRLGWDDAVILELAALSDDDAISKLVEQELRIRAIRASIPSGA